MHVLIIGGGKAGAHLGQLLAEAGHGLTIIEQRPEVAAQLSRELPRATIVVGDGSAPRTLRSAQIHQADVVATVTGADEDNLAIALLAHDEFRVPRVIARVNNPKNAWLFTPAMGVDAAVNQAGIMAQLIQEEISVGEMVTLLKLRRGELTLVEERLAAQSQAVGRSVAALDLPRTAKLIAIVRKGGVIVPHDDVTLEADDELLALAERGGEEALATAFR